MGYTRARAAWYDWPDVRTPTRAQDYEKWDQGLLDVKTRAFWPGDYGTDGTALALQGALDAAHTAGSGVVELSPNTSYDASSTSLTIYGNTILRGQGWGSIIKSTGSNTILTLSDPVNGTVQGVGIENLRITGGTSANGGTGIRWSRYQSGSPVTSSRTNYIKGCELDLLDTGLRLVNDQGIDVTACRFESNRLGAYAADNSELGLWEACDFRYNSQAGALLENTNNIITPTSAQGIYGHHFSRCHWEANTGKGISIDGAGSNLFSNCKWEANGGSSVELVMTNAASRPDENVFENCIWNGNTGSPQWDVDIQRGRFTVFIGGSMCGAQNNGINIGSTNTFDTTFVGTTFVDTSKIVDPNSTTWYLATNYKTRIPSPPKTTPTYGGTVTPDFHAGRWATVTVTNGVAFTMAAPNFPPSSTQTDELIVEIFNNSGGAMGAITWTAGTYVLVGGAFTNPASTFKRFIKFEWNGTKWIETSRAGADY